MLATAQPVCTTKDVSHEVGWIPESMEVMVKKKILPVPEIGNEPVIETTANRFIYRLKSFLLQSYKPSCHHE
jgi:hypothetical protein